MEIGGQSINFLDLNININKNRKLQFDIYRKPTATNATIYGKSFHPYNHKNAAYLVMMHRLVSIPLSKKNFEKETETIKCIAKNKNIQFDVEKIIKKKIFLKTIQQTTNLNLIMKNNKDKWIPNPS